MERDVDRIIGALTLEEKASLLSGKDFWNTKAVERLDIPSWMMTDGPHGLRKQSTSAEAIGLHESVPATCFPSGAGLASTWNRSLVREVGEALGAESKAENVGVILGPAVNIKRSPLCGRNFEYFSEDPFLSGEMAKSHIAGVQSQGVGTSLKHFAANNQETARLYIDALVDERTLREIYFPAFEAAVKEEQPWTVMCSYNRVNGVFSSENPWLIDQVLRREWGFQGLVVTDWGACKDRVKGLEAGIDLEMPGSRGLTDAEVVTAVNEGRLDIGVLDAAVKRLLRITFKVLEGTGNRGVHRAPDNHGLARRVAAESFVLLKNERGLLPIKGAKRVAFIGEFVQHPRYQGGGSSHIKPTRLDKLHEEARAVAADCEISYAPGYSLSEDTPDRKLISEAASVAASADCAVVFVGLPELYESEGFDRSHMRLPASHDLLVTSVLAAQPNTIIVLSNGSPVEMPWIDDAPAVLETYLGGQAWGGAVADILFGVVSPSGKLAETFPKRLEDNPSFLNFPGDARTVEYREGIFVGYRYYDAANVEPLFPFGHGLSYSEFRYSGLKLDKTVLNDTEELEVSIDILNVGSYDASEVVQLYVADLAARVIRPVRELKAFRKVPLRVGERKTIRFLLDKRAFAFWSAEHHDWVVETGEFEIAVGSSSRDLRERIRFSVRSTAPDLRVWDIDASIGEIGTNPVGAELVRDLWPRALGIFGSCESGTPEERMFEGMARDMPLRNLVRMGTAISQAEIDGIVEKLNAARGRMNL